jgi:tRNA(fMet)-specific endonuclease VapC
VRYLADTDYLIDARGGISAALGSLQQMSDQGVAVSIVSLGEIFEGAYGFPDPARLLTGFRQFLATYPVLPLIDPIMEVFAATRARLRRTGQLIPDLDLLIAATAIHHDLALVTRNRRHFDRIPGLNLHQP